MAVYGTEDALGLLGSNVHRPARIATLTIMRTPTSLQSIQSLEFLHFGYRMHAIRLDTQEIYTNCGHYVDIR
jgi:hypothetical protein